MPIIEPDMSEVKEFVPLEPGVYPAKIKKVDYGTSKSGNPMITVFFDVTSEGVEYERRTYLVVTGAGAYGFDSLLRSVGFTDIADKMKVPGAKVAFDTDSLVGLSLNVQIDREAYQGQMRDNVKGYLAA